LNIHSPQWLDQWSTTTQSFFYKTGCVGCKWLDFSSGGMENGTFTQNFLGLSATLPDTEYERWEKFPGSLMVPLACIAI
jgi:hypothetical protein